MALVVIFLLIFTSCTGNPKVVDEISDDMPVSVHDVKLEPLYQSGILSDTWYETTEIPADSLLLYSKILKESEGFSFDDFRYEDSEIYMIPSGMLTVPIADYFGLQSEYLLENGSYDSMQDAFWVTESRPDGEIWISRVEDAGDDYAKFYSRAVDNGVLQWSSVLTLKRESDGYRYISNVCFDMNANDLCVALDVATGSPDSREGWSDSDLYSLAKFFIGRYGILQEKWEDWMVVAENEIENAMPSVSYKIPLDAVEKAISEYIGSNPGFNPGNVPNYDPASKAFSSDRIGGDSGVRNAKVMGEIWNDSNTELTLIIDYFEVETNELERTVTYRVGMSDFGMKIVSIESISW